jgi:nitric oxide reductase NorQ protein
MTAHPATALTLDMLSPDRGTVRQVVIVGNGTTRYRVLSRQLTTSSTSKHWKNWPVDSSALKDDPASWLTTYTKIHADRNFALSAAFVCEVTASELEELATDTTPRALMIRIDRSRDSVAASIFAPMPSMAASVADTLVTDVHTHVREWSTSPAPVIAPAGRARAPKAAAPAAATVAAAAPVAAAAADPGAKVNIGARIIIETTGATYLARKLHGTLSDVQALRDARVANLPVIMESLPGTGKTMAALAAFGTTLLTVQCTGETEASDFVGTYVPTAVAGEFRWVDGPLVTAMEEGRPLLVDEIALADPRAVAVLLSAMDGRREIVVTANPSRGVVRAREGFFVLAAFNAGVPGARMSEALLSRFSLQIGFTTDFGAMEKLGVDSQIVTACRNLDKKRIAGEINTSPQARELVSFMNMSRVFGPEMAVRNMIAAVPESDRDVVKDVLQRAIGRTIAPLTTE